MQSSMNQSTWVFMMFMKLDMLKIDVKNITPRYGWIKMDGLGGRYHVGCWKTVSSAGYKMVKQYDLQTIQILSGTQCLNTFHTTVWHLPLLRA